MHEARMALTELARRLHSEGHLENQRQLFMATDDELDILIAEPEALRERLAEREKRGGELAGPDIPTFLHSRAGIKPLNEIPRRAEAEVEVAKPGDVLQGGPASAGVARGRARVIRDTASISEFQPGEVLVAPQTDPSWTPLFMVASAVVVDVGAMGSHAMIVSRELGIPCAAGVTNATRRIPTGAEVEGDGATEGGPGGGGCAPAPGPGPPADGGGGGGPGRSRRAAPPPAASVGRRTTSRLP